MKIEKLKAIKEQTKTNLLPENGLRVVVGMATCGIAAGARPVLEALTGEAAKLNLQNIEITQTGCIGICQFEPVVEVISANQEKTTYINMTAEKAVRIAKEHLENGQIVTEYTIGAAQ